jgi:hypothetical protein
MTDSRLFHIITLLPKREASGTALAALANVKHAFNALEIERQSGK